MSRELLKRVFDECSGKFPGIGRGVYDGFSQRDWEQAFREIMYILQAVNEDFHLNERQAFFFVDTVAHRVHATPEANPYSHAIKGMEVLNFASYINSCRS